MTTRSNNQTLTNSILSMAVASVLMAPGTLIAAPDQTPVQTDSRVLLKLQASISEVEYAQILKRNMGRELSRLDGIGLRVVAVPTGFEAAVAKAFSADARVAFAEPDRRVAPSQLTPNDLYYGYQWHLAKIGVPTAWDYSLGGGVIVAVIDSGVQSTHPDLAGHLIAGWNVVSNDANTEDQFGHGTKVAGIIGAASNNAIGLTGMGWDLDLMPLRVTNSADGSANSSDIATALIWAADHGARVANISYDVNMSGTVTAAAEYFRSFGGVVVVPAGNDGTYNGYGDNAQLITVSATDSTDAVPSWSSYGTVVDLAAPGASMITTAMGAKYASVTGTSFASPVVAGVAALMVAANPALTADAIEQILEDTALDLGAAGWDQSYGYGRVDAAAAVQMAMAWTAPAADTQAPSVAISSPAASAQVSGTASVTITASDNVGVTAVKLYAGSTLIGTATAAPYAISLNTTAYANGALQLTARAYDAAGNEALSSAVAVTVSNAPADTIAPTATITAPTANKTVSGTVTVKSIAADNVAVATMTLYVDNVQLCTGISTALNCSWNTTSVARGTHVIKLTATDRSGNAKTTSVSVRR